MSDGTNPLELLTLIIEPEIEKARQRVWFDDPEAIVSAEQAARLLISRQLNPDQAKELGRRNGFSYDQFDLLTRAQFVWPNTDQLVSGRYRGFLTDDQYRGFLDRLGLTPEAKTLITQLGEYIPGPQDVLRFFTRDAFIPEFVEAFGMDKEQPPDARDWFQRLGISQEVQTLFWRAHWDLPSLSQGYEMFQRHQINEIELRRLMRAQGVEPFWRDPLINIAFNPLTRVDIRRIHKLLKKDRVWLIEQYENTGYSADNADTLAQFTEELNRQDKKHELASLTTGLRTRIVSAAVNGTMDDSTVTDLLKEVGYDAEQIGHLLTEAQIFRREKYESTLADLYIKLYVKGKYTDAQLSSARGGLGYSVADIERWLKIAALEKELHAPSATHTNEKDLTLSFYLTAYKDNLITRADAAKEIVALHYDPEETELALRRADYEIKHQALTDEIAVIHATYKKAKIGDVEAKAELDKLGVPVSKRNALIAKWDTEIKAKTADIPLAQVQETYLRDVRDVTWVAQYLTKLGYDDDEKDVLLHVWDSKKADAAAKAAATAAKKTPAKTG